MKNELIAVSAAAVAALFLVATSVERAAARDGGRGGAPSAGPRSVGPSGGSRVDGGGPSAGRSSGRAPSTRSFSGDRPRTFSYRRRFERPDYGRRDRGRRHVRRFRGHRFFYDAIPPYGAYTYESCAYYYERAVATGSDYWWDRYYDCTGEDYD